MFVLVSILPLILFASFHLGQGFTIPYIMSHLLSSNLVIHGRSIDDPQQIKTSDFFSLDSIRSTLIRQEETIIFALIERAQYRKNDVIYDRNSNFESLEGPVSFLEWMLIETEKLHAKVRRYTSPEEHPFFPNYLPQPILSELNFPEILVAGKEKVNVNTEVMTWYIHKIIDRLCVSGDDEQHGSSVLCDINAMQALSRRVHYGKFVAESKFLNNPDAYTKCVHEGNVDEIIELLTNTEVEKRVLQRSYMKASAYGHDINLETSQSSTPLASTAINIINNNNNSSYKVDPKLIADIYRDMIIPLTKDVEIRYLFQRVGREPPCPSSYIRKLRGPQIEFSDLKKFN